MALTGMWLTGVEGSLPAAGVTARLYLATDTSRIFLDTGSTWVRLNLIHRGIYAGGTTYYDKDLVSYNGSVWRALATGTGVTPVEGANWTLFVSKGDAGSGLASIDGVSNTGGNVDLIAGTNVTITPDDTANTITIAASGSSGVASVDGVSNAGGDIDLVAGSNVTITPNDAANTITIASSGGSPPFSDSLALVQDNIDSTKKMNIECTDIATGQWRVLRMPDRDINLTNVPTAAFAYYAIPFSFDGTLPASLTGRLKGIVWKTGVITKAFAKVRTAPTTQSILVDLNLNGTTIWSTQANRLAIAAAGTSGTQTTFNTTAATEDDYVTCDLDQAGSGTTGADLTVFLVIRYAL